MSKKDDEYHQKLLEEAIRNNKDAYLQSLITLLDDPDYDSIPVLIDSDSIIYPEGASLVQIIKGLQNTMDILKKRLFNNGD